MERSTMEKLFNFSDPFKSVFTVSLFTSLICTLFTIIVIIIRVMPHSKRNRPYYIVILAQAFADFIQNVTVVFCILAVSFKVKYTGIWMFQASVMLTAYLAIYWMHVLLRSSTVTRFLMAIVSVLSVPMLSTTSYLIIVKNVVAEFTTFEWYIMSGSRNFAQLSFGAIIFITCVKVYRVTGKLASPGTRRLHRKVWIGLVFKTICSVSVALFGVNTFVSVLIYGGLGNYMRENTWWETAFFTTTCLYAGLNSVITCWMLSALIWKKSKTSPEISKNTVSSKLSPKTGNITTVG